MDKLQPSKELRSAVLSGLRQEERRRARVYLSISALVGIFSLAGLYASIRYVIEALYQSGFFTYLSLLFSDTSAVFAYWQEFAFSLAETLPFWGIVASLSMFGFLLISLRTIMLYARSGLPMLFKNA